MALRRNLEVVLALLVVAVALSGGGRAMADQSDCGVNAGDLSACFDYSSENPSTRLTECCNQLANVVNTHEQCLCDEIKSADSTDKTNIFNAFRICNITACNDASDGCRMKMSLVYQQFFPILLVVASFVSIFTAII